MIFEELDRQDGSPKKPNESAYEFWNRCSGPIACKVRGFIENSFANYCNENAKQAQHFRKLIRNPKNDFHAFFFELLWFEFFRRIGTEPIISPTLEGGSNPELVLAFDGETESIFEATMCNSEVNHPSGVRTTEQQVFAAINRIDCTDFALYLHVFTQSTGENPQPKRIANGVQQKLNELRGTITEQTEMQYEDERCVLKYVVEPCSREPGTDLIRCYPGRWMKEPPQVAIRRKLRHKYNQHDLAGRPYVVAVNSTDTFTREDSWVAALYGDTQEYVFSPPVQRANGLFGTREHPINSSISAVIGAQVFPTNIAHAEPCLYHNPFAWQPLSPQDWPLRQAVWDSGKLVFLPPKKSLATVFELPSDWPGGN